MKKLCNLLILLLLCLSLIQPNIVYAKVNDKKNYIVYTEDGNYLFERPDVMVGDSYISKSFKKYEIIEVDESTGYAKARFLYEVKKPKVDINLLPTEISQQDKVICLYMTHNDESYVPTDGTESVYGAGGIHDVAKYLLNCLSLRGIETYIDETLHIPHDSLAYSRSKVTANKLISQYSPNAIFDIHRDGTSRAYYVKNISGEEKCMIRMVVGKANGDMKINEQFAVYLMAVAEKISPNLFKDIYYASGHYNQALHPKALLFEMGSHLVEKDLVMKSVDDLAEVIDTALFATTVNNETGNLTINNNASENETTIDKTLDNLADESNNQKTNYTLIIFSSILAIVVIGFVLSRNKKNND